MALSKSVADPATGMAATYWRVHSAEAVHGVPSAVYAVLHGYVSKAAREEGAAPVMSRCFRLVATDFQAGQDMHAVSTETIYDAIKERVDAAPSPAPQAAPLSASDATSSARAPVVLDMLAGAVDA